MDFRTVVGRSSTRWSVGDQTKILNNGNHGQ